MNRSLTVGAARMATRKSSDLSADRPITPTAPASPALTRGNRGGAGCWGAVYLGGAGGTLYGGVNGTGDGATVDGTGLPISLHFFGAIELGVSA